VGDGKVAWPRARRTGPPRRWKDETSPTPPCRGLLGPGHQEGAGHQESRARCGKHEDEGDGQESAHARSPDPLFGTAVPRIRKVVHVATIGRPTLRANPPLVAVRRFLAHRLAGTRLPTCGGDRPGQWTSRPACPGGRSSKPASSVKSWAHGNMLPMWLLPPSCSNASMLW